MKTYKQFCEQAGLLNNPIVKNIVGRTGAGRLVRALGLQGGVSMTNNKVAQDLVDVGTAGLGFGPAAPVAMAGTAASKVYGPLLNKVGREKFINQNVTANLTRAGLSGSPSVQKKNPTPGDIEKMTKDYMKTIRGVNGPLYGSSYRGGV